MFCKRTVQQFVIKKEKKNQWTFLVNEIDQMSFLKENVEKMQTQLMDLMKKQAVSTKNSEKMESRRIILHDFFKQWILETELIFKKFTNDNKKIEQAIEQYDQYTSQEVNFNNKIQDLYVVFLNSLRLQLRKYQRKLYEKQNMNCHKEHLSRLCLTQPNIQTQEKPQTQILVRTSTRTSPVFQYKWKLIENISQNYHKRVVLQKKTDENFFKAKDYVKVNIQSLLSQVLEKQKYKNQQLKKQLKICNVRTNMIKAQQQIMIKAMKNLEEALDCAYTEKQIRNTMKNNEDISFFYDFPRYFKRVQKALNLKFTKGVHFLKGSSRSKSCPKNFKPNKTQILKIQPVFDGCKSVTMSFMVRLGQIGIPLC